MLFIIFIDSKSILVPLGATINGKNTLGSTATHTQKGNKHIYYYLQEI